MSPIPHAQPKASISSIILVDIFVCHTLWNSPLLNCWTYRLCYQQLVELHSLGIICPPRMFMSKGLRLEPELGGWCVIVLLSLSSRWRSQGKNMIIMKYCSYSMHPAIFSGDRLWRHCLPYTWTPYHIMFQIAYIHIS